MVETLLAAGKRETAIDMIPNQQPQAASGMSESSDTAVAASATSSRHRDIDASSTTAAPIATIEGHDDADLKITVDGGDVATTTKGKVVTSPPSCTRLDEASQACV